MSGFFFFFVFFSLVSSLSRKNLFLFSPSSLSSSFLSLLLSCFLSVLVRKRREKIYLERSARFRSIQQRERRIFAPLTLERYRRKGNSHRYYFFLLFFRRCCSSRGGERVSSVCDKKGVMEYFRDDPTKERKKWGKVKKRGSWFSWNCPKPKGRKKIQNTCLHTKLFITYTRCCAYHQPAADQTYYRCLGAITSFILLFLLRWERAGAEKE